MLKQLQKLLAQISWLHDLEVRRVGKEEPAYDLEATIPLLGGKRALLCVECKKELRATDFPRIAAKIKGKLPAGAVFVLGLPWASGRVGDLCAQAGWSWYDLAGNCCLDIPGFLHLSRTGNPPLYEGPRPKANLRTVEAAWVVRALLHPDGISQRWTQHSLRQHCVLPTDNEPEVSIGLVNKVVRYLVDEAFVTELPGGGFRVVDPVKLLLTWRDAYRFHRHQRLAYFTLLQGAKLANALAALDAHAGGRVAYAAYSAADFQSPHVRQSKTWLYVSADELDTFDRLLEAKCVDSGENLVVLTPEDDGVFYMREQVGESRMPATSLVQTYVDLWHVGGRGKEAAESVLNRRIIPEWKEAGWNP